MLAEQFAAAVAAANNFHVIEEISRQLWAAHAAGALSDAAAQAAAEAMEARKATLRGPRPSLASKHAYAAPKPCRSPDRARSIARRRAVAASGAIPAKIACHFTQGQVAVLAIIAGEVRHRGRCDLPIDAIAAMAGCSRTVVQSALRQARSIGLVHVQERPQPGRKNLTNFVTIISPEWLSWLRLRVDRIKFSEHHEYQIFNSFKKTQAAQKNPLAKRGARGQNQSSRGH
jgi:hypothetical protein